MPTKQLTLDGKCAHKGRRRMCTSMTTMPCGGICDDCGEHVYFE